MGPWITLSCLCSLCVITAIKLSGFERRGKTQVSLKDSPYTEPCILEKRNPKQVDITKPVKSHRGLLTSSSNLRDFTGKG